MNILFSKIIALTLIFLGDALSIYAEIIGARGSSAVSQPSAQLFMKMFLLIALGGGFLVAGYMLGATVFRNIWVLAVASITAILIVEPLIIWMIFHQAPTAGAAAGFTLGILGLILSIFF